MIAGGACTVLAVAIGLIPDAVRAILTLNPLRPVLFGGVASAGAVDLVKKGLGRYGVKWGETLALVAGLVLALATVAGAVDRGAVWEPGGITPQEDGANFAVLPFSDTLTLIYTRVSASPTQLRVYESTDSGQTIQLAQSGIVTGRSTAFNPNAAMLLASSQTLLSLSTPGAVGTTPEAPWLRGTGQVWTTPTVTGLPTIGPAAPPFPSPFSGGFLRAVATVVRGATLLSVVDNNSSNPPVICRSVDQAVSFACAALPGTIGTVRWRDPQSGSTSAPGTAQPLVSPGGSRWLLMDSLAQVYRSADDGLTWTFVTRLTTDASISWAITCLPPFQVCVALTSSYTSSMIRIFRSTDGGATWAAAFAVPRGDLLTTLVPAGANTVLALGDPSAALPVLYGLQSQDGGVTWFPIVSPRRAAWAGPTPLAALSPTEYFFSGFEEIAERATTWVGASEPTGTLTNPRAVGPGRSLLSDTESFGGILRHGMACAAFPCTIGSRWYVRLNTATCASATGNAILRMVGFGAPSGHIAVIGYRCAAAGVFTTPPRIAIEADGALTWAAIGAVDLALNQWYRIEWRYTVSSSVVPTPRSSTLTLYAEDSLSILDALSFADTRIIGGTSAPVDFTLSSAVAFNGTLQWQVDDVAYRLAGSLTGPGAVWTLPPTSDVAVQWSPATANWTHVDDVPGTPDDAADAVSTATIGATDRLAVAPVTGAPYGWRPRVALVNARAERGGSSALQLRAWDSLGQTASGPSWGVGSYDYALRLALALVADPRGANVADLAKWQIGYAYASGAGTASMTSVWLSVLMEPDSGAGGGGDSAAGDGPSPFWAIQAPYVRPDGSVLVWAFWSDVLGASTSSYLQAFNAAPTIPTATGFPLPSADGAYVTLPAGASLTTARADVTVTTTATAVLGGNLSRLRGTCVNHGPNPIRLGDATVTTGRGVRAVPGRAIQTASVATVYAIAEAGTATVSCSEDLP